MVDDGDTSAPGALAREKHLLCGEVSVHVAVEVQVVPGQVRKYRCLELNAVYPAQAQRMRGGLHRDVRAAEAFQFGEQLEQVERLGRRVDGRQLTSGEAVLDGTDQRRRQPRCAEDGIDQVSGCRFPVRARDADDFQPAIGMVIEVSCGGRQRLPPVRDMDPEAVEVRRSRRFTDNRDGALLRWLAPRTGVRRPSLRRTQRTRSLARLS